MGYEISKSDVFELLEKGDVTSRLNITSRICQSYTEGLYSEEEIGIAVQIFCILLKDSEVTIRATLSEALKLSDDLPHDIALALAKDVSKVAIPMLEFSTVLNDGDLLDIIYNADIQKLLAISKRRDLTHEVVHKLLEKDIAELTDSVFENADFTNNTPEFDALLAKCAEDRSLMQKVVHAIDLPINIVEKLLGETASQIYEQLKKKYHITPDKLDRYVSHSYEISLLTVIDQNSSTSDIEYLVDHLMNFDKLSPSLILSAACMGRKRFFTYALAKRAGIPVSNAVQLMERGGPNGLHALLRRAGIPDKLVEVTELVIVLMYEKKAQDPEASVHEFCSWLISRLEYFAEKNSIEYVNYMLALAKNTQKARSSHHTTLN